MSPENANPLTGYFDINVSGDVGLAGKDGASTGQIDSVF